MNYYSMNNIIYIDSESDNSIIQDTTEDSTEYSIEDITEYNNNNIVENISENIVEIDDYSINTEEENMNSIIHEENYEHSYSEKQDNHYYIGLPCLFENDEIFILSNTISKNVFFKYSHVQLLHYLWSYSVIKVNNPRIHILKLNILPDGTYSVLIKTFWISIIQQKWKVVYALRKKIQKYQMLMSSISFRERNGRFPNGLNLVPGLKGLLVKCH